MYSSCTAVMHERPSAAAEVQRASGEFDFASSARMRVGVPADRRDGLDLDLRVCQRQREREAVVDVGSDRPHREVGVEQDASHVDKPQRLAQSRPRSVNVRTSGTSRSSSL